MKKSLLLFLILSGFLFFASPTWSVTIVSGDGFNGLEVGGEDFYLTSANIDNNDAAEEAWLEGFLQTDITYRKYEPHTIYQTSDTSLWALQLEYQPEYFFVKVGNGNSTFTHHLFRNDSESLDWGVFNSGDLTFTGVELELGFVSHAGGAAAAPVPEPSTILLLGLGLVGVAGIGRKRMKH